MDDYDSDISSGCMLYPVFCTSDIKPDILDDLIINSRKGLKAIQGEDSAAFYFLDSNPGVPIVSGSHLPMKAFHSSWIGKSLDEVYSHYKTEHSGQNNGFCDHTFAILDEESVAKKTMLLATDKEGSLVTLRSDFYSSLHELVPVEMGTAAVQNWKKYEVITREIEERKEEEYRASIYARKEKGEPLRDIEKKAIGEQLEEM
ncbi:hypothetical protein MMC17_001786 [Xylographa soralifera]|nr:hypothetical protein [Xylographa soralifera]